MKYILIRNKILKKSLGGIIEVAEIIASFIPGVSEAMDVAGIAKGLITGNTLDAALSTAGLITPAISGKELKIAKKALLEHSDEIMSVVNKVNKKGNIMDGPLKEIQERVESGALKEIKTTRGTKGSKAFKELNIDARNHSAPLTGYFLDEKGILRTSSGDFALKDPDFRGFDIEKIREELNDTILNPGKGSKYASLRRISEEGNVRAKRYLESAQELEDQLRHGNIKDLPRFNPRYGGTPHAEHVVTAKALQTKDGILLGSGYHSESPYVPGINKRTSVSGNMNFIGDTRKAVVGYHSANPKDVEELIPKLKGIEKEEVKDAYEFIKIFDEKYKLELLGSKLPSVAYADPQINDYIKAREIISLALGQTSKFGQFIPVVYETPELAKTVILKGNGIAAWDDLTGAIITHGASPYGKGVTKLADTMSPSSSLDIIIGKDSKILAMRLDDTWNRPLMQTVGLKGGLFKGMKNGGKINGKN